MSDEKIAILDAGSQYGKLIDRKIRQNNCFCELLALDTKASYIAQHYKGVIISGGPSSFHDENAPKPDPDLLALDIPILGICYGMQWLCLAYKGTIERLPVREDGQIDVSISDCDLFDGLKTPESVLLTHGDSCTIIPDAFETIAKSTHAIAAIKHRAKPFYGVQFHPEVDLTLNGLRILSNFLFKICKFRGDFKIENRIEKAIDEIRAHVSNRDVVVLVSGGVDSTICCALLYKALGIERVHAIHIDTGLMRMNEDILVKDALEKIGFKLKIIYAWDIFSQATTQINGVTTHKLCNAVNPEEKRKIIGDTFIHVVLHELDKLGLKVFIVSIVLFCGESKNTASDQTET
jgi:GMP synthase (glutamine-hydrolysing)